MRIFPKILPVLISAFLALGGASCSSGAFKKMTNGRCRQGCAECGGSGYGDCLTHCGQ